MDAMADPILYPRSARSRLEEALKDTPVVLVHGPRQCGKTTLARMVGDAAGYEYITFDDDVQLGLFYLRLPSISSTRRRGSQGDFNGSGKIS